MTISEPLPASVYSERLQALRDRMKQLAIDAFLVPMADVYQNEYVPSSDRRIAFLTGFTGSSAFVLVQADKALFFTDSRYTLQANQQLSPELYTILDVADKTPSDWLKENLKRPIRIGFDPCLHSAAQIERIEKALGKSGSKLTAIENKNPIDAFWTDKPAEPCAPVTAHDIAYAGRLASLKQRDIAEQLKKDGLNAAVITSPASIAWLLNVRGGDVPHTPLPLSTAIIKADATVEWYVQPSKVSSTLPIHLGPDVTVLKANEFATGLKRLGEARNHVRVDVSETAYVFIEILKQSGATIERGEDPCALPRACKNKVEIDGMRSAHHRDGAALVRFLAWFDQALASGERLTELDVESKLESFRTEGSLYQGVSFDTIAGAGPNGAVVHYRATPESNRVIDRNSFFLLDSGGQYLDGTTDVTRTIATGDLTPEMKDRYTRVLKGHIALASIRFPEGTSGADLDVLARQFLWAAGLDYGHGTGHGVGSYLSVHEGPQAISRRGTATLKPGMVLSNEPGYYKANHYGIRLENLQFVTELFEISSIETKMFGFELLTLVPFDRRAILPDLLCAAERDWLNAYHERVNKALRPQLDAVSAAWLEQATATI